MNKPYTFTAAQLVGLDNDPDRDSLTICTVGARAPTAERLTVNGSTITYTPPPNYVGSDSFSYSIADPFGGVTNSAVNVVIRIGTVTSVINNTYQQPDGSRELLAFGIPGRTYMIQASTNMLNWMNLTTNVVPSNSTIKFFDLTATNYPIMFYRLVTLQ